MFPESVWPLNLYTPGLSGPWLIIDDHTFNPCVECVVGRLL
jgi:hypothetical protein